MPLKSWGQTIWGACPGGHGWCQVASQEGDIRVNIAGRRSICTEGPGQGGAQQECRRGAGPGVDAGHEASLGHMCRVPQASVRSWVLVPRQRGATRTPSSRRTWSDLGGINCSIRCRGCSG